MSIFNIFGKKKKRLSSTYEEVWEKADSKEDVAETNPEWKGASKRRQEKAKETRKETRVKKEMLKTELQSKAEIRKVALAKAKEIHGDKAFGLRTVQGLEMSVDERFEVFHRTVDDVVRGIHPFTVIYGTAGVGKSHLVKEVLEKYDLVTGKDYAWLTSRCTAPALFETGIRFRKGGILVLDDVDFSGGSRDSKKQMREILKCMTDSSPERIVNWSVKSGGYEQVASAGEGEDAISRYEKGEAKKLPSQYRFDGRLIIITNLTEKEFDDEGALLSRAMNVPLFLTEEEKLERMKTMLRKVNPEMDIRLKEEVLSTLIDYYEVQREVNEAAGTAKLDKTQLDLRTLVSALKMAEVDNEWRKRMHLLF